MHHPKTVLVPIANGTEEIETTCIVDTLRRAELNVTLASIYHKSSNLPIVKGSRDISIVCDNYLENVINKDFDLIALPGGAQNAEELSSCQMLIDKLQKQKNAHKWYAAMCASPALVFEPHGLLEGVEGTCYPSFEKKLKNKSKIHQRVVVSKNCITSQGPGTALEFALMLVEKLVSPEKAAQLAKGMLAYIPK